MRKLSVSLLGIIISLGISAQDNMEAFRHFAIGVEGGLHGLGVEVAMPVHKSLVVKAGVNFMPSGDLFSTDLSLDTEALKEAQEESGKNFEHKFGDEAIIDAGLGVGLTNFKLMLNWHPFAEKSLMTILSSRLAVRQQRMTGQHCRNCRRQILRVTMN